MKKLVVVLFTLAIGVAFAQPPQKVKLSPDQKADKVVAKMDSVVTLSADQQQQVRTITLDKINKIQPIRKDKSLSKEQRKEKVKPIRKETREEIKKVLTKEQQKKWRTYKKAKKKERESNKLESEDDLDN